MLNWKGTVDNDFFNENNWQDSITFLPPSAGTINPGVAITEALTIANVTQKVVANGSINLGGSGAMLFIQNAWLSGVDVTGSASSWVSIDENAYLDLNSATPVGTISFITIQGRLSWVRTFNVKPTVLNQSKFRVNGGGISYSVNTRLDNYYDNGCVIRQHSPTDTYPLIIYSGTNLSGTSANILQSTISSGGAVGDNNVESFLLKKGYMASFNTAADGTGKSKIYIASEEDLIINVLPITLQNTVSFIRVIPWNWVTKKGVNNSTYTGLNAQWRYDWNDNSTTSLGTEFVPMSWGSSGTLSGAITTRINAYGTTHELSFNEPDNVGQSGGFNGFTDFNVTVPYHKELMKIGCRLVSPGCTESQVFVYMNNFKTLSRTQNVRYDAIAIHWSDWSDWSSGETGVTATQIFNRFKIHLKKVYDMHGLPIWVTEFNANPNRSTAIHEAFLALALPYLESCEYVERYNWFEAATCPFYVGEIVANGITTLGTIYRDHISTPSIPESVVNQRNNLNLIQ